MNCTVCGAPEEHFTGENCVGYLLSKLGDAQIDTDELRSTLAEMEREKLELQSRLDDWSKRWEVAEQRMAAMVERATSAERRLGDVCSVEHEWRDSTFEEFTMPHEVCRRCDRSRPKASAVERQSPINSEGDSRK